MGDNGLLEPKVFEASIEGHIVALCPGCLDPMLLGEGWRELVLEGHDVPECPVCDDGHGDSWADGADPVMDALEYWAIAGDELDV